MLGGYQFSDRAWYGKYCVASGASDWGPGWVKGRPTQPLSPAQNLVRSSLDFCRGAMDQPPLTLCARSGHAQLRRAGIFDMVARGHHGLW